MGIFANFDIIKSFQYGIDNVKSTRKAQATQLKSLDALKDPSHRLGRDSQSLFAMQKVVSMHKAVESLRNSTRQDQVMAATIASANDLDINAVESFTNLQSTEEVNTTISDGTVSDPVTLGSTTPVTVSGTYDGSNGNGQLTVEVLQGGAHGQDDLELKVLDADNNEIQTISISQSDALNQQYDLGNGLSVAMNGGDLLTGDRFGIDVTVDPSSYADPTALSDSTAAVNISGQYDGSNGSGQLTVEVVQGGTHGTDDLQLQVFDADNNAIQTISISQADAPDQQYDLGNGLSLSLDGGEVLTGDRFGIDVVAGPSSHSDPTALSESTATASVSGQYDGSNGSGQLSVEVVQGGTHGTDDLQLQVFDADNNAIQSIYISQADAIDQQYDLSNGLSLSLDGGELLTGDRFGIDVVAGATSYSDPTELSESTANASISGIYEGTDGTGQLSLEVVQGGLHGTEDLQLQLLDANGNTTETFMVRKNDAIDKQYDLGNGLSLTLGGGELLTGDQINIDVSGGPSTFIDPTELSDSSAVAAISGTYDGTDGTGQLSLEVVQGGLHGTEDLQLQLLDANGNTTETFMVRKNDAIDKQYDLGNGLSLTLGEGDLLTGDTIDITASQLDSSFSNQTALSETTATAAISGTYDGTDGNGQLSIEVLQGGTHGSDDLQLQVYDANGNATETFTVRKSDAINKQYDLGNGLSLALGAGDMLTGDSFTVDVTAVDSSVSNQTTWEGTSSADATLGGEYDGSSGTGAVRFEVVAGGTHGSQNLKLRMYDTANNVVEDITIRKNHALDQVYSLANGMTLSLGSGDLVTGDTFTVDVVAGENSNSGPSDWAGADAVATVGGTYDGSNGSGTLIFEVTQGGTLGTDALSVAVYDANNNQVDTINIGVGAAAGEEFSSANGLTVSFSQGSLLEGSSFTVDVIGGENEATIDTDWAGADAQFTVGGAYDGSNGTGTLTFEVTQGGTNGTDNLNVAVYDASNNQIDTISINNTDPVGQEYSLSNGMTLSLGTGDVLAGASFTVDVVNGQSTSAIDDAWGGADATFAVSGTYDGSNGSGTLTFEVTQGGTLGTDALSVAVYDANNNQIDTLNIASNAAAGEEFLLSNGLSLSLGAGNILEGASFTVDVTAGVNSSSAPDPWTGADATFAVSGTYDGSDGSGTLTFEVAQGGTHGTDDLSVAVYDANSNQIDTIAISSTDAIAQQYTLSNGLNLTLGEGNILEGASFTVDVTAGVNTSSAPDPWTGANAEFAVGGSYDGSNGSGTLTFEVAQGGTHGTDDLSVRVLDADNNEVETISINSADAADQQYSLSNGLTLSLGEGNVLEGSRFSVDVVAGETTASAPSAWTSSEAAVTVGGTYDGSNGNDTLSLKVDQGGIHGTDDLQLSLYDSANNALETITVSAADPLNQQYTFTNGLNVTLGAGTFVNNTTFSVDVAPGADNSVDPDKAFNGVGEESANLETGQTVTAGSFQINGSEITVNADDSINSVLDRINNSDAGVSASFDSGSEKILLTQTIAGPTQEVSLANDTSGFLSATKLDTATATPGELSGGVNSLISDVTGLDSVQNGTLTINNVDFSIDVNSDSLQGVIDQINSSDAGVTASLSDGNDRISLTAVNNQSLVVDSGDTNFFTALAIEEGTHNPTIQEAVSSTYIGLASLALSNVVSYDGGRVSRQASASEATLDSEMMATMVNLTAESMNGLFDDSNFDHKPNATVRNARKEIHSAISSAFGSNGVTMGSDVGVEIDFSKNRSEVMKVDQERIGTVLSGDGGVASMRSALFGNSNGSKGLLGHLDEGLNKALANLLSNLGSSNGVFLDISA